jgi:hypothetical protein
MSGYVHMGWMGDDYDFDGCTYADGWVPFWYSSFWLMG